MNKASIALACALAGAPASAALDSGEIDAARHATERFMEIREAKRAGCHHFDGPIEGHSPGMPIHFDLHAWLDKRNPAGRFEMFNERVQC